MTRAPPYACLHADHHGDPLCSLPAAACSYVLFAEGRDALQASTSRLFDSARDYVEGTGAASPPAAPARGADSSRGAPSGGPSSPVILPEAPSFIPPGTEEPRVAGPGPAPEPVVTPEAPSFTAPHRMEEPHTGRDHPWPHDVASSGAESSEEE